MTSEEYVNFSLPQSLVDEIDKVVGNAGYKTRTEFVKDACRRRLEDPMIIEYIYPLYSVDVATGVVHTADRRADTKFLAKNASGRGAPGHEPPIPRGMPSEN